MIKDSAPEAMVCIGGMEGVFAEVDMFNELGHGRPIFTLEKTGGAASLIADRKHTISIDLEVMLRLEKAADAYDDHEIDVQPYPLIMQTIVDRIAPPSKGK